MYNTQDFMQIEDFIAKARKDLSKLQKKTITDKNGKKKTIWVSKPASEAEPSLDAQFEQAETASQVMDIFQKQVKQAGLKVSRKELRDAVAEAHENLSHTKGTTVQQEVQEVIDILKENILGGQTKDAELRYEHVTKESLTPEQVKQAEAKYAKDTGDRPEMAFKMSDWVKDNKTGEIVPSPGNHITSTATLSDDIPTYKPGDKVTDQYGKKLTVDSQFGSTVFTKEEPYPIHATKVFPTKKSNTTSGAELRKEAVQLAARLGLYNMVKELENPNKVSDKEIQQTIGQLRADADLQKKQGRYRFA